MNVRILNVAMRGATLGSRFALLFFLARYLSPAEVGEYGIIFASVSYALFIVGLDFYTYSTRELMGQPRDEWSTLIFNHVAFIVASYAVMLPLISTIVYLTEAVPRTMTMWFVFLLIVEHLGQEFNRLLISMSRPLLASTVLFIRSGSWVIASVLMMFLSPKTRNLPFVFSAWMCGGLIAVALGVFSLKEINWSSARLKIDWKWIGGGLRVALPLLVGTLASRALFTIDRYFERQVAGNEILGAYTFYIGITNAILAVLDAAVISIVGQRFVAAVRRRDRTNIASSLKEFSKSTVMVTVSLVFVCAVAMKPISELIGKEVYVQHLVIFYILLVAAGLFCLSMIPHFVLYANGADKSIIIANILGCAMFFIGFFITKNSLRELSVPLSLIIAIIFNYSCKKYLSRPFVEDVHEGATK